MKFILKKIYSFISPYLAPVVALLSVAMVVLHWQNNALSDRLRASEAYSKALEQSIAQKDHSHAAIVDAYEDKLAKQSKTASFNAEQSKQIQASRSGDAALAPAASAALDRLREYAEGSKH